IQGFAVQIRADCRQRGGYDARSISFNQSLFTFNLMDPSIISQYDERNIREYNEDTTVVKMLRGLERLRKIQEPEKNSRQVIYRKNFLSNVISKTVAPFAVHSTVQDQLEYLNEYYVQSSSVGPSSEGADEEAPTVCSVCRMPDKTDHFPTKDGVMCRECLASFMTRQLRMKSFPIEIPILVPPKCSPIELLYAVLPLPVTSLLIEKSFAFFNCLDFPDLRFLSCAHCSASLMMLERCDFNSYSCPCCGYAFCLFVNQNLTGRWTASSSDDGANDGMLNASSRRIPSVRVTTSVSASIARTPFELGEDCSPYDRCYLCWYDFDTEKGEYRHWHGYEKELTPNTHRLMAALGVTMEYCAECGKRSGPHTVQLRRLVDKDFSVLCWEARQERFNKSEDFRRAISKMLPSKKEQCRVENLRKTILFVVENCTAWLYLTKPADCNHLKLEVSRLFRQLLAMQRLATTREIFKKNLAKLEMTFEEVVSMFDQRIKSP
ncbi:hypothetical protein OESDEN_08612, partial [Oesophagostomum dentatum]